MTLDVLIEKAMDKNKKEIEERRIREEIRNKKKQVSKLIESYFNKNAFKFKELEIAFPFFNAKLGESLIVFEGYTKNKALFITEVLDDKIIFSFEIHKTNYQYMEDELTQEDVAMLPFNATSDEINIEINNSVVKTLNFYLEL
jgi:hypothetical protein